MDELVIEVMRIGPRATAKVALGPQQCSRILKKVPQKKTILAKEIGDVALQRTIGIVKLISGIVYMLTNIVPPVLQAIRALRPTL